MLNVSFSPFGVYYPLELAMVLKMLLVVPCLVGELAAVLKVITVQRAHVKAFTLPPTSVV